MSYKYDTNKLKELEECVVIGMTDENSAVLAFDIDRSTYYDWISDESILSDEEKNDIIGTIENGKAKRNKSLIKEIREATKNGDGKLALDLLKRLERKAYGDKSVIDQKSTNIDLKADASADKPVKEQVAEILDELEDIQKFNE